MTDRKKAAAPADLDEAELDSVVGGDSDHKAWVPLESLSSPISRSTGKVETTWKVEEGET